MLLSELCLLIASPSMAGGMLACTHIGAGGFSVWWQSNIRSCMHLVMSVPLKRSLLGQFLAHQTSEKVKHCCVKKQRKWEKVGRKMQSFLASSQEKLRYPVTLYRSLSYCPTKPEKAIQLHKQEVSRYSGDIQLFFLIPSNTGVTALFYIDKSYCKCVLENFSALWRLSKIDFL